MGYSPDRRHGTIRGRPFVTAELVSVEGRLCLGVCMLIHGLARLRFVMKHLDRQRLLGEYLPAEDAAREEGDCYIYSLTKAATEALAYARRVEGGTDPYLRTGSARHHAPGSARPEPR